MSFRAHLRFQPSCFRNIVIAAAAMVVGDAAADARVVRISVNSRVAPAYSGKAFGGITYEILSGHASGELDPKEPLNAIINDIALAPRNARGKVEYSATFTLVKPIDPSKGSGVLIYQVPNRGNSPLNPQPPADELNGGHILLSSGWQGDLTPRQVSKHLPYPPRRTLMVHQSPARSSPGSATCLTNPPPLH